MTREWERLQELFEAAVDLAPADRAAYLDRACAGDARLRQGVEGLLRAERRSSSSGFIAGAIAAAADALADDTADARVGQAVGPYRLVRELGRGGMGRVYLAERSDHQYQAEVAIKFVQGGFANPLLERRFLSERQILADLNHPGIARLLDGGAAPDGTPFLVMERIEGEAIDRYCDRHRLGVGARLELFLRVAEAVQYAHQALVVHRDIKPSNILVTADGHPKLLDFGIAKLLSGEGETADTTSVRAMTPAYASPEQVRGGRVTVATDVYSLGVVLYRLLAGREPFDLTGLGPAEVERLICEGDPERPSIAVRRGPAAPDGGPVGEWSRTLTGDLDTIALTAMRKVASERYASVAALADDVRRYLERKPIAARPATWTYRAGKFIRRHRRDLTLGAGATGLILALTVFYLQHLSAERDRATLAAAQAGQVSSFLTRLFQNADPSQAGGEHVTARAVLDAGVERINKDLATQPGVRAALKLTMAEAYRYLGAFDQGAALATQALATRSTLFGADSREAADAMEMLGSILYELGRYDSVRVLTERALRDRPATGTLADTARALSLNDLAWLDYVTGDNDASDSLNRAALAIRRRLRGVESADVAESLNNLAAVRYQVGDLAGADSLYTQALAIRRRVLGDYDRLVGYTLSNLAVVREGQGRLVEAESLYRASLDNSIKLYGPGHADQATSLVSLGRTLRLMGRLPEAGQAVRQALRIDRAQRGDSTPDVAYDLRTLGAIQLAEGRLAEAESSYRGSIAIYRNTLERGDAQLAPALSGYGAVLIARGRAAEAERALRESLRIWQASVPEGHHRLLANQSLLGAALAGEGKYAVAESLLVLSYQALKASGQAEPGEISGALDRLISFYHRTHRPEEAARYEALRADSGGRGR